MQNIAGKTKDQKTEENKRTKKRKDSLTSVNDEDDIDQDGMDWWTKYHASVEVILAVEPRICQRYANCKTVRPVD